MQRHDALRALDIYRRAGQQVTYWKFQFHFRSSVFIPVVTFLQLFLQAERLSEFYEVCKSIDVGRGERFIKIEQV